MRRQLICQTAHLAPAHRVGLAGHREWPHAGSPDPPRSEVHVDDRIAFVHPAGGLVDALRKNRHGARGARKQAEEFADLFFGNPANLRHFRDRTGATRRFESGGKPLHMRLDICQIECVLAANEIQQAIEQMSIRSRCDGQVQIGDVASRRAARIDDHHPHVGPRFLRGGQSLVEYGVRPGIVRTRDDDEIGGLDILVTDGNHIGTEGALVRGHRRRHAQARIGVDVRTADESLHQFVGDVIVFGQKLAGNIERHGVRPVLGDDLPELVRNLVKCLIPSDALTVDQRIQ